MSSELFPRLKSRYKDGYIVALATVGVGTGFKVIGVIAGIIIVLAAVGVSVDSGRAGAGFALGLILGGIVGALFYVIGTMVSAQGQILRATLDSAVNNSPHISNEEKAGIMFLSSTLVGGNTSGPETKQTSMDVNIENCRVCGAKLTWSDRMNSEEDLCKEHRHSHASLDR